MSGHTPGPWEFDAWNDIRAGHDTVICGMGKSCGLKSEYTLEPKPVMIANARLIAASPDQNAAITAFLDHIDRSDLDDIDFGWGLKSSGLIEQFRAALAKATGGKA
jgi:hypothetical protein